MVHLKRMQSGQANCFIAGWAAFDEGNAFGSSPTTEIPTSAGHALPDNKAESRDINPDTSSTHDPHDSTASGDAGSLQPAVQPQAPSRPINIPQVQPSTRTGPLTRPHLPFLRLDE